MRLGFHLSIAGGLTRALEEARVLGCEALQIFVQNPRSWREHRHPPEEVREFTSARRRLTIGSLVVHLSYLPNLAAAEPGLYQRSRARLALELELARDLEADFLVAHPGHGEPGAGSFRRVAAALAAAVHRVGGPPPLMLLENTAGQGRELGWRPEQLAEIGALSRVPVGICLDTAHAFGAGYDLRSAAGVEALLADLALGPGLEAVKMLHLNDSRTPLGSRRDRHMHLGQGAIGLEGLRRFLSHPWLKVPAAIMETPRRHLLDDRVNLAVARSLVAGAPALPPGVDS